MDDKTRLLLLATNSLDLAYIRLGDEMRDIEEKIQCGSHRDSFDLIPKPAVRVSDLELFFLRHRPNIVHLSGHGRPSAGIILEDESGNIKPVGVAELRSVLRIFKKNVRLTFLNVCYSKPHAEALSGEIDYAIGMDGPIQDESAIVFAAYFYQALAFGRSVVDAFEAARNELDIEGLQGADVPALLVREGVDASRPFITGPL